VQDTSSEMIFVGGILCLSGLDRFSRKNDGGRKNYFHICTADILQH